MDCATCSAQYSLYLQDLIRHFMALVRCHVHLLANRPSRSSTVRIKPNDTTSSTALTLRRELEAYTEPKQNKEKRAKTRKIRPEQPRPTEIIFKYHMYAYLWYLCIPMQIFYLKTQQCSLQKKLWKQGESPFKRLSSTNSICNCIIYKHCIGKKCKLQGVSALGAQPGAGLSGRTWSLTNSKHQNTKTPVLSGSLNFPDALDLPVLIAEANASVAATVHQEDYEPGRTLQSVYSSKCSQLQEKQHHVLAVKCSLQDLAEPLPCLLPISSWQCTHPAQVWHPRKAESPQSLTAFHVL